MKKEYGFKEKELQVQSNTDKKDLESPTYIMVEIGLFVSALLLLVALLSLI